MLHCELQPEGVLIQADALHTQKPFCAPPGAGSLLNLDGQSEQGHPAFSDLLPVPAKAQDPFDGNASRDHTRLGDNLYAAGQKTPDPICEARHGTSWIVEVSAICTGDSKRFRATHRFLKSL
jgi:hypothetical protein